jgi:hypothetical protein
MGTKPPASLQGLLCTPIELPGHVFDGHLDPVDAIFEVACACGSREFIASGWMDEGGEVGPPVTLECYACEAEYEIFDPVEHGFDAGTRNPAAPKPELGPGSPEDYPEPEPPYEIIVRFEVDPGDPRGIDAFTWITVLARKGARLTTLIDWECA